jgi:hypothetical protein
MSVLTILVAIGVIAYVIGAQVIGQSLTGRRAVVFPAVLTVIGVVDLASGKSHPGALDVALIALSAAIAIAIGLGLGFLTHIERREGHLWVQLPKRGLWLWAALFASRLLVTLVAHASGADIAAGTSAILLVLGLNRVAQALIVVPRAVAAGIPFAPEKDGRVFGAGLFEGHAGSRG